MSEFSSLVIIDLNELDDPTGLRVFSEGDTIASSVLPENVRNAASGFDAASASLKAQIDEVSSDISTVSATVDSLSLGTLTIPDSVSSVWQVGGEYAINSSGNIAEVSSGFGAFSGNVESSVGTINNSIVAGAISLSNLTASTSDLSGYIDQNSTDLVNLTGDVSEVSSFVSGIPTDVTTVSGDLGVLDASVVDLNTFSGSVESSVGVIGAEIDFLSATVDGISAGAAAIPGSVSGPWENTRNWVESASANIIEVSSGFSTFSGNVETSVASLQTQIDDIIADGGGGGSISASVSGPWEATKNWVADSSSNLIEVSSGFSTFSGNVESSVVDLDTSVTNLNASVGVLSVFSGNVETSVANLETSVITNYNSLVFQQTINNAVSGYIDQVSSVVSTNTGNISTNTGNISTNATDIDNLEEYVSGTGGLKSQIDANASLANTANTTANTADGKADVNTGLISDLQTDVTNLTASSSDLSGYIDQVSSVVSTNTGNISTNTTNIANLTTSSAELSGYIDQVSSIVSTNTGNISTNAGNISTNATDIGNLEEYVSGTGGLKSQINANASLASTANSTANTANDKADINTGLISDNATDITNLTSSSAELSGYIDQVSSVVDTNTANITANDGEISFLSSTIDALDTSITTSALYVSGGVSSTEPIVVSGCPYPAPVSYAQIDSVAASINAQNTDSSILSTENTQTFYDVDTNYLAYNSTNHNFDVSATGLYFVAADMVMANGGTGMTYSVKIKVNSTVESQYTSHPQLSLETIEPVHMQAVVSAGAGDTISVEVNPNINCQAQQGTSICVTRIK